MKKYSSRFGFTENEMAEAFQQILTSPEGLPGIGTFDGVYREISCRQGQPDFITLRRKDGTTDMNPPAHIGFIGSSLLSLLKPAAPRTLQYLLRETEYSTNSVRKSLSSLEKSGYISRSSNGLYTLGDSAVLFKTEMWAFELKLSDSKRALFQAQQCKAFAEITIIVVPPGQTKNYNRFEDSMFRWGIGLAAFDPFTGAFTLAKRPRKTKPLSRQHRMYALSQVFSSNIVDGKIWKHQG
jgi:hypothetical protein